MHTLTRDFRNTILRRVSAMSVWRRGDQRAPHKPLLFLLAIARVIRKQERLVTFVDIEEPLTQLLRKYAPARAHVHPEYPFWWLQTDGLWEIPCGELLQKRVPNHNPTRTALRASARGGFPADIDNALRSDGRLAQKIISLLLNDHFPRSLHEDILADIGIDTDAGGSLSGRDARFRQEVIAAYEHRCAVCGFDVRVGAGLDLALEAAHVKWHQAGGPDVVQNGLALCAVHHKAFDLGAIGLDIGMRVLVSGSVYGQSSLSRWFLDFHGKPLRPPHSPALLPDGAFLAWHRREVFRKPPRA